MVILKLQVKVKNQIEKKVKMKTKIFMIYVRINLIKASITFILYSHVLLMLFTGVYGGRLP